MLHGIFMKIQTSCIFYNIKIKAKKGICKSVNKG